MYTDQYHNPRELVTDQRWLCVCVCVCVSLCEWLHAVSAPGCAGHIMFRELTAQEWSGVEAVRGCEREGEGWQGEKRRVEHFVP